MVLTLDGSEIASPEQSRALEGQAWHDTNADVRCPYTLSCNMSLLKAQCDQVLGGWLDKVPGGKTARSTVKLQTHALTRRGPKTG